MVTGGGVGLGRKISLTLSEHGYRVAVTDIEGVEETTRDIEDQGGEALAIGLDLTSPQQIERAVATILDQWGWIDVLVNNAGIAGPTAPVSEVALEDWEHVIAVNLTGSFLCAKAVYRHMMARQSGSIVNISSMAGRLGFAAEGALCRLQVGRRGVEPDTGGRVGALQRPIKRDLPRSRRRGSNRTGPPGPVPGHGSVRRRGEGGVHGPHRSPAHDPSRRHRRNGPVPGVGRLPERHRPGHSRLRRSESVKEYT